jgi:hypothetical protein
MNKNERSRSARPEVARPLARPRQNPVQHVRDNVLGLSDFIEFVANRQTTDQ